MVRPPPLLGVVEKSRDIGRLLHIVRGFADRWEVDTVDLLARTRRTICAGPAPDNSDGYEPVRFFPFRFLMFEVPREIFALL